MPLKSLGALAIAAGAFVDQSLPRRTVARLCGAHRRLAGCGCLLAYGTDAPAARLDLAPGADYTPEEARAMLEEAEQRVPGLERAAAGIGDASWPGGCVASPSWRGAYSRPWRRIRATCAARASS